MPIFILASLPEAASVGEAGAVAVVVHLVAMRAADVHVRNRHLERLNLRPPPLTGRGRRVRRRGHGGCQPIFNT